MLPLVLLLAASCATASRQDRAFNAGAADPDAVGVMRALGSALRAEYGASVVVDSALGQSATAQCLTDRAVRCVAHGAPLLEAVVSGTPVYAVAVEDSVQLCAPAHARCAPGSAAYFVTIGGPVFSADSVAHVDVKVRSLDGAGPMAHVSWIRHTFVREAAHWRHAHREAIITG